MQVLTDMTKDFKHGALNGRIVLYHIDTTKCVKRIRVMSDKLVLCRLTCSLIIIISKCERSLPNSPHTSAST